MTALVRIIWNVAVLRSASCCIVVVAVFPFYYAILTSFKIGHGAVPGQLLADRVQLRQLLSRAEPGRASRATC